MSLRKILLIVLLVALAASAGSGFLAVFASSGTGWSFLGAAITAAVTACLMLPLTLLLERPKLRLGGIVSCLVLGLGGTCVVAAFLMDRYSTWAFREVMLVGFVFDLMMGLPAAFGALFISFRWARFAVPFLLGLAAVCWVGSIGLGTLGTLMSNSDWTGKFLGSGAIVFGLGLCIALLLVNAGNGDRRYFRYPGITLCVVAGVIALAGLWLEIHSDSESFFFRTLVVLVTAGIVLAHINLLLMAPLRAAQRIIVVLTIAASMASGITYICAAFVDVEMLYLLAMAGAVATGCASVAIVVLSLFNRKSLEQGVPGAMTATQVSMTCPRCGTLQSLPFGDTACKACDLFISIKFHEPRCPGCGYLLYKLTSPNCPECGASIASGGVAPLPA